jgi:signal transduction histidine kinase/ActR/RegA family two-component response regulator
MNITKLIYFKRQPLRSMNLIGLSVFFSLFYWMMESVRDVLVFNRGRLLERLFTPDPMSLWMRLLIVMILILFGVYAQSLKNKLEDADLKRMRTVRRMGMIYRGLGFGLLYWFLEALRDVFVFNKGSLLERLTHPDPVSVWMRMLAICIMLLFSIYAQNLFEEREKIKQALQNAHDELEDLIRQRTAELSRSYELLKKENEERRRVEDELLKVNRALKTLSQCNEVMVRAVEESALLNNICKTIVGVGGYQLAWVGLAETNGKLHVRPVSHANQADYDFELGPLTDSMGESKFNPIHDVVRTGQSKIIKYEYSQADAAPWMKFMAERGISASLFLPLKTGEKPIGALNIYSTDSDAFDTGEMGLLQELADDLAFGITALRTQLERNRAEAEKERIQAQLLHAQKLEAVGILAGGVAHDFNNMLTAIQVSADLAMLDVDEATPVYRTLQEIHQVSSHAGDLTRQLLLFSRKHPMEYVPMNLNRTVENLKKMLNRLIGEDIEIQTRLDSEICDVMADQGTIEQVVMNLILNARDAMPDGGRLTIQTGIVELNSATTQKIPESRPGRFVKLTVQDTGVGMTPETVSQIFEPFFSTKGPGKGTGLGLSVVYGIVKQHEGWITVTSVPGKGSNFDVYMPAASEATSESAVSMAKETEFQNNIQGKGERILLVEDERSVQEFTVKALIRSGYAVTSASSSEEAMQWFKKENGKFDLVFSDVVLPDQSGIELVEKLQAMKPKIKVLLCSGYTDQKSQWPIIRKKGFRYLQKPYSLNDLLKTLKEVLKKE